MQAFLRLLNAILAGGLAAFLASSALAAGSDRANNPAGGTASRIDVLQRAQQNGMVRIIVQLRETTRMRGLNIATAAGEAAYESANLELQSSVLSSVFGAGASARGLKQISIAPIFSLNASVDEISALRADSRVLSVGEDLLLKPALNDSVKIVRMTGTGAGYAKAATGTGRAVAVLDTGVNKTHEFMTGKVVSEACYNTVNATDGATSRCPGGATSSTAADSGVDCLSTDYEGCGHGSHVAGIAAGFNTSVSAGEPTNGIAKRAGIVAINIFSAIDNTSLCGANNPCLLAYDSDIIAGLERVYQLRAGVGGRKIDAVNLSLGGGGPFSSNCNTVPEAVPVKTVIDKLRGVGIATVIAAGNNGFLNGVTFPGCIGTAITVASSSKRTTGKPERISIFSNMGVVVDAIAPGGDFSYPFNTSRDQILSQYDSGYAALAGTSMATPAVAGVIAALRSRSACRGKSVSQIETGLRKSGLVINDVTITGKRRVDIVALMKYLGCYN